MNHWNAGYVTDIDYAYGYYADLNPLQTQLAFASAGLRSSLNTMTACELGFGQGVSTNIHAAATNVEWYGTDFNPSQTAFAQEMAQASGANIHLYDQSFAEFASRTDLPDFDFIVMHGIWSWINDENRTIIVDFIRRKLKVGGVVYVSYNTPPGWAAMAPIRHLMAEHAQVMGANGVGVVNRFDGALNFIDKLFETNPVYIKDNSKIASNFNAIRNLNKNYLVHEFFNQNWDPMYFSAVRNWFDTAKLGFACSSDYVDYAVDSVLPDNQKNLLNEITDATFRETVRDFMVNRQFRRDYWVKGHRSLSSFERIEALRSVRLVLIAPHTDITPKVRTALGNVTLNESVYNPILHLLSDYQPKTIGQIEAALQSLHISLEQILEIIMAMTGVGYLSAAQNEDQIVQARPQCEKLNAFLLQKSHSSGDITYLASPVTGGGILVSRFEQLFLVAIYQGKRQISDLVDYVWNILSIQGEFLMKEGKLLETAEENVSELNHMAQDFATRKLPLLQALQII